MAFNYSELTSIKQKMVGDSSDLESTLNNFSSIVDENVNNPKIWEGKSSAEFMARWEEFETNFVTYKNSFQKEIENLEAAIEAYHRAEQD